MSKRFDKSTTDVIRVETQVYNPKAMRFEHRVIASYMNVDYSGKGNVAHCYISKERNWY